MAREGFIGMDELKANMDKFADSMSGTKLRAAKRAGAEVLKSAIESATPIGKEFYEYKVNGRTYRIRSKHSPGQARSSVIIYERKSKASLSVSGEEQSLLVGYSKDAYYMYFVEYGTKNMSARPFFRSAFDGAQDSAFNAMISALKV
jgi:HK97 gp10 family phage protein